MSGYDKIAEALRPLASLGLTQLENIPALAQQNIPFYDCPNDLVLWQDGMGNNISVGDVRRAHDVWISLSLKK